MINLTKEQRTAISLFTLWWGMHEAEAEVVETPFKPDAVVLNYMGCGASTMVTVKQLRDVCEVLKNIADAPVIAGPLPELPEPLEIDWPTLNSNALGCGVEDRGLHGRYECAEYGWQDGVDRTMERVPDAIYDADQMNEHARLAWNMGLDAGLAHVAKAVVYPPDGTTSPFTVINLGGGMVKIGDSFHDGRLPALWFGKDGLGMGVEEKMNREAADGETLAVVTFSNVEGLDVLAEVVRRIRGIAFPVADMKAGAV